MGSTGAGTGTRKASQTRPGARARRSAQPRWRTREKRKALIPSTFPGPPSRPDAWPPCDRI
eukprot:9344557-Pyramimonas_sp.AAC.1